MILDQPSSKGVTRLQQQILAAPATNITFSGLKNEDGEAYRIVCDGVGGTGIAALGDVVLKPNGATANQLGNIIINGSHSFSSNLYAGSYSGDGYPFAFDVTFFSRTGLGGKAMLSSGFADIVAGTRRVTTCAGWWQDTAEVTSLVLTSSTASAFGTGTRITLYALK